MKRLMTVCLMAVLFGTGSAWAQYSGGTGEPNNPYQIGSATDLLALAADTNDYGKCFILTADIDLAGVSLTPVGTDQNAFTGVFDGNGHVIHNAVINLPSTDYVGLFGSVGSGGQIKNLGVEDANITGQNFVGGLAGFNLGSVTSCYVIGSINGIGSLIGGLIGSNTGSVTACYATGAVTGYDYVGGLVGTIGSTDFMGVYYPGSITSSYAAGSVKGHDDVGGLVAGNYDGSVTWSFWDMNTSGQSTSGGGRGLTTAQMKTLAIFRDAGWGAYGWVMADGVDYPRLSWEGTGYPAIPAASVPLTGSGTAADPYQIRTPADFALLGWYSTILDTHILLMNDIDVTGETLYPIGDLGPFTGVFDGNDHVIRNAFINLPSSEYVGLFAYVGFGGQIKNLGVMDANITGGSVIGGLVGNNYGSVSSCYATGSVSVGWGGAGGLVGYNWGSVNSSYATCSVNGHVDIGGLVGWNFDSVNSSYAAGSVSGQEEVGGLAGDNDGSVTSCYATGPVNGQVNIGGLVGDNYSANITSSYATGSVNGGSFVGGLVGKNAGGSVTACYSTGSVTGIGDYVGGLVGYDAISVTSSFWDMQTSGQSTSAGGTGETTAEMQTKSTFTNAGWDFVNVWKMRDHLEYPRLIWENTPPVACIVGGNKTLEAQGPFGARGRLDGSCSSDADSTPGTNDDINDFNWYKVDPCNANNKTLLGESEVIDCNLPLGKNIVMLEVIDKAGASDSNEITVTVQDTTPPDFKLSVTPTVLWPPNHKMVKITSAWTVHDLVDPSPVVSLIGVTCNDSSAATDDIQINNDGSIYLRAEKGRIYTITYKACDFSSNCTSRSAFVTVPHDNGK